MSCTLIAAPFMNVNDIVRGASGVVDLPMVASMLVKVAPGP
jgi:hypothetical protein